MDEEDANNDDVLLETPDEQQEDDDDLAELAGNSGIADSQIGLNLLREGWRKHLEKSLGAEDGAAAREGNGSDGVEGEDEQVEEVGRPQRNKWHSKHQAAKRMARRNLWPLPGKLTSE
jgi:hypothetical protein